MLGGSGGPASVLGTGEQLPVFGAAFANAELINALDYDTILPPGHVTPYVLPVALAVAESLGSSGKDYIVASAIAHEMSYRMGKAMDYLRDTRTERPLRRDLRLLVHHFRRDGGRRAIARPVANASAMHWASPVRYRPSTRIGPGSSIFPAPPSNTCSAAI